MSDLKITHAGTVQTQTRQGPMNPFAPFGQVGSVYTDEGDDAIIPPLNQVFIAITMVENCTFDTTTGLIAEDSTKYINSAATAHNADAGSETSILGSGGLIITNSIEFPAGMTIYGRWIEIDVAAGGCVAYIG